ncbi:MAG: adenine deaminase [Alphaproteobacteria bacterium]|jgi:adenine deaminase|nr:adenine deaminase [Alphaproteobacteria bacterium]MBT4084923.1 adenine deaminase [Alphaproteobacteria bacterium]MBT4542300.1 adenine deaminase [Alphaproteobacteria bacterium]MBT7746123.1 adenine deaminase [Alphaproteobacteria bacterium]
MDIRERIRAGLGETKADLVITGGNLVNVASAEIYLADVAIKEDTIVATGDVSGYLGDKTQTLDASGRFLAPGLIDGHLHIECSKLSVTSFANLVVPFGTTSIVSGLDQILVVAGLEGVRAFLDEANESPVRVFWGAPCKTPYTMPRSTVGHYMGPEDHQNVHHWHECIGVWETVREFIQEEDEDVLSAMEIAAQSGLPVFGCAPMARGQKLNSYLNAGIRLDHESYTVEEAHEKLRNGMFVIIRESSISHFLEENIQLATKLAPDATRRISFCTDDVVASDVLERGHIDNMVRMAIAAGVEPMKAIQMATINSAEAYRIDHMVGLIAPGRKADILIIDEPSKFNVERVISKGQLVAENKQMIVPFVPPKRDDFLTDTFKLEPVTVSDLKVRTEIANGNANVQVLSVTDEIFVRKRVDAIMSVKDGIIDPDVDRDLLYMTVVERYGKTDNKPVAFATGFNLKSGALASSTAPDDNNIVCVGTNSEDMAVAINWIIAKGGGQVVVRDGEVIESLELPIGGIVADIDPAEMAECEIRLDDAARDLGCDVPWPFMYMFVLSITAIPDMAMTDLGVVDCVGLKIVEPVLGAA